MADPLHILAFGAHPDDCDARAGGLACLYAGLGHRVRFVSLTDGGAGHHETGGVELVRRRHAEAQAAARVAGIEYVVLDSHDGELEADLANRRQVVEIMRTFRPDLVLTHRPVDYHPDHRAAGVLVQDASYLVTVPNYLARVPHLLRQPVIAYTRDGFTRPTPLRADLVVDIDSVFALKTAMLHCHTSQMYEWLPYNAGRLAEVPEGDANRLAWLADTRGAGDIATADRYRDRLVALYGAEHASQVVHAEAFELCEYGAPLPRDEWARLLPFLPAR